MRTTVSFLNDEMDGLGINGFSTLGFLLNNGLRVVGPCAVFPRSILQWNVSIISAFRRVINRAHSFPWKMLPNSAGQFAKFHGSPRQNCLYSAAHHDLLFMSKLSSMLFRTFSYWRLALPELWHSIIKWKSVFFFSKVQWNSWLMSVVSQLKWV